MLHPKELVEGDSVRRLGGVPPSRTVSRWPFPAFWHVLAATDAPLTPCAPTLVSCCARAFQVRAANAAHLEARSFKFIAKVGLEAVTPPG